jgi:hypothetical protein
MKEIWFAGDYREQDRSLDIRCVLYRLVTRGRGNVSRKTAAPLSNALLSLGVEQKHHTKKVDEV